MGKFDKASLLLLNNPRHKIYKEKSRKQNEYRIQKTRNFEIKVEMFSKLKFSPG